MRKWVISGFTAVSLFALWTILVLTWLNEAVGTDVASLWGLGVGVIIFLVAAIVWMVIEDSLT